MIEMTAKVKWHLDEKALIEAVQKAIIEPLEKCALLVEGSAKESMKQGGRSAGPRGGKKQTPSTPGNPPNVQSGNMRGSIRIQKTERKTFIVGPTRMALYAKAHEYGGRHHPKRPFMRPALLRMIRKFPDQFKNLQLKRFFRGSNKPQ